MAFRHRHLPTWLTALWRQSRSLFIRTMTVGPGITPGLLTLTAHNPSGWISQARAGYAHCAQLPPVGSRTPP